MTVKELSDALAGWPDDAQVVVPRIFGGRVVRGEYTPAEFTYDESTVGVAELQAGVVVYLNAVVAE